jgi:hypothetical protein
MASFNSINENTSKESNKLVIIGNGFDLAHGLKTSYRNFLDWYICKAFRVFCDKKFYSDSLIEIRNKNSTYTVFNKNPFTFQEAIDLIESKENQLYKNQHIVYKSKFLKRLIDSFNKNNWVDIECEYFRLIKAYFSNTNFNERKEVVYQLNKEFNDLIEQLSVYIEKINKDLPNIPKLEINNSKTDLRNIFNAYNKGLEVKFLNFNYTDTLYAKYNVGQNDIIHIHGRVSDVNQNPIIFGYGDESDPDYQNIEDSGENIYLEHLKSFGYFKTDNYHKLLSFIDSAPFTAYIIGHSCGLTDRVLLNEIFEHPNCEKVEIFYHVRQDGSDNFKEITHEVSRHFKPHNKNLMRRRISNKNSKNVIPQN